MKNILINEAKKEILSILDILRWTISQLLSKYIYYGHGTNNPWDESKHLVLFSLNLPLNFPIEMYYARLTYTERTKIIERVILRTQNRIPVPYLTNKCFFCGLEFYVDKRVFIPRSPISEIINNRFKNLLPKKPKKILDMCTGSGCIAISCAYIYPEAEIDAVEISYDALKIAEYNIQSHEVENQVTPIHSNLFCNLPSLKYDLIISNPPYVNKYDMNKLPKEFHFEPLISLISNDNGMEIILKILKNAIKYLTIDGVLICEVGDNMINIIKRYPKVPFYWLKLQNGGEGVFMITYKQLKQHQNSFKNYNIKY